MKKATVLGSTLCKRILAIMLCVCMLVMACGCDSIDYKKATKLYNNGEWDEAIEILESLGSYEDSKDMVNACNYEKATELYENKDYDEAIEIFESLGSYEDSKEMVNACNYGKATELYENKNYDEAIEIFTELSDYEDSESMIANCKRRKVEPYLISNYVSLSANLVSGIASYTISQYFYDYTHGAYLALMLPEIAIWDGISFDFDSFDWDNFYIAICQEDNRIDIYIPDGDNIIFGMQYWPDEIKAQVGSLNTKFDIVAYLDLLVEGDIIDEYDRIPYSELGKMAGIFADVLSD